MANDNQEKKGQDKVSAIMSHVVPLYDLLEPGMTLNVTFPEINAIHVPGQPPKLRRIIIVRPLLNADMTFKQR